MFPFDPDAIIDSLAELAPVPEPSFPELEIELHEYQPRPDSQLNSISAPWAATRDSLEMLSAALSGMDRTNTQYRRLYRDFRDLYSRLMQRGAAREASIRELLSDDADLARRAESAADSVRSWEAAHLVAYSSIVGERIREFGWSPEPMTTDSTGRIDIALPPGSWWILARRRHPTNPYLEYYWHQAVHSSRWVRIMIVTLDQDNALLRWRH